MARKRNSKTRAPTPEKIPDPRPQIWDRSWFPALLLALISLVYFSEFVSSDKIVFGIDVGTDYHLGLESIAEKIKGLSPPVWNAKMGMKRPNSKRLGWLNRV